MVTLVMYVDYSDDLLTTLPDLDDITLEIASKKVIYDCKTTMLKDLFHLFRTDLKFSLNQTLRETGFLNLLVSQMLICILS